MMTERKRPNRKSQGAAAHLPDVRDGLTPRERVVLRELAKLQAERGERGVPLLMLYGRVLDFADMSKGELREILARLGGRGVV